MEVCMYARLFVSVFWLSVVIAFRSLLSFADCRLSVSTVDWQCRLGSLTASDHCCSIPQGRGGGGATIFNHIGYVLRCCQQCCEIRIGFRADPDPAWSNVKVTIV
jgi:hypothetical protein